ncbi:hypothetical protein NDU88_003202 [Pleurodeles waltl]|uniref:Uncharacterized protein n=1 Tax=Pleurodeles waltl TaxID=8319 RepID=A0AAV7PG94_PLEWA|nr:hypothetical protein NDU88_003202 [Pleurodeles waltl]
MTQQVYTDVQGQQLILSLLEVRHPALTAVMEEPLLILLYQSIKQHQEEMHSDSRRAPKATKKLQGAIKKFSKTCREIAERISALEDHNIALESDLGALRGPTEAPEYQFADVLWKIEDYENPQRNNNLRFLGIAEGVKGGDMRAIMISLFKGEFPELNT